MSKRIIVLDPGHGKNGNPHTTREGFYEGSQNFLLASFLRDELLKKGFDVRLTRNDPIDDPTLSERGELAGNVGAAMFLSLHSNAPGTQSDPERYPKIRGAETYYSISDEEKNAKIAKILNDTVVRTMNTLDRGIKTRRYPDNDSLDYYGVLRAAAASGCKQAFLIEHGFHTNPEDSAFLQDKACLIRLAEAESEAIDFVFSEILNE